MDKGLLQQGFCGCVKFAFQNLLKKAVTWLGQLLASLSL
jgi:hypothetical protein